MDVGPAGDLDDGQVCQSSCRMATRKVIVTRRWLATRSRAVVAGQKPRSFECHPKAIQEIVVRPRAKGRDFLAQRPQRTWALLPPADTHSLTDNARAVDAEMSLQQWWKGWTRSRAEQRLNEGAGCSKVGRAGRVSAVFGWPRGDGGAAPTAASWCRRAKSEARRLEYLGQSVRKGAAAGRGVEGKAWEI